jgi:hypothetical protein
MAKVGVVTFDDTPLAPSDYRARRSYIQTVVELAKRQDELISPTRIVVSCGGALTVTGLNHGFSTLEDDGFTPTLVFVSARCLADIRLWGRDFYHENDREYALRTGCPFNIWGADIYMDYRLPEGTTLIASNTFEHEASDTWQFSKVEVS